MNHRSQAGFTLLEAIVSVAIMIIILLGLLGLLDFNSRVAKAQVNVAEMQQSLRAVQSDIVRMVRMAGRGGLPAMRPENATSGYAGMLFPHGYAIAVRNNVGTGVTLGSHDAAAVLPGTDVLTVRGVIQDTLYQVATGQDADGSVPSTGTGTITVRSTTPGGIFQELKPLQDLIAAGHADALLLVSSLTDGIQAVVEVTGGTDNTDHVVLSFRTREEYDALSPDGEYPSAMTSVSALGILEEFRYYVRDAPGGPRLSRARFDPGTENAYRNDTSNLTVDLADNILDLQVALGIDTDGTDRIEDTGDGNDDWLFNHVDDHTGSGANPIPADWNSPAAGDTWPLYYLRLTTLARTDRADLGYISPPIDRIEDHVYGEPATPADGDERRDRTYRRRVLQTVIDLRNLS
jgi:type II secretory pathway pseudopilin PulG